MFQIEQLSLSICDKHYHVKAVDNISFVLNKGETLALLGESGSGKSLTALAIMRLLPDNIVYGKQSRILLDEQDILNVPEWMMQQLRGKRLGLICQEPMIALNPVMTVAAQLSEAILQHERMSRRALKARMLELLSDVEIPDPILRLKQYPHQLSGGQRQRVVIAMALAHRPHILIADEPTTALDVTIQIQILRLLQKLQKQCAMSLILITHDLGVVKMMAQHICVMYAGQIIESSPAEAFFAQPLHPYVQQLLLSAPSYAKRGQLLKSIPGCVPQWDNMPSGCRFHNRCAYVMDECRFRMPNVQSFGENRLVRCHWYDNHHTYKSYESPKFRTVSVKHCLTDVSVAAPSSTPLAEWAPPILEVCELSVQYELPHYIWQKKYNIQAVESVTFQLYAGKTMALVGESGSGKTSIARAILQLLPMQGRVLYRGKDVGLLNHQQLKQYRHKVQMVFQDPFSAMNPRMTIAEILSEGMRAQGLSARSILAKQYTLLDQVGLARQSLTRYPHQFSGGQRQRICIARALATEPDILICDEPTSALDISIQAQILNLLKELQEEFRLAYLLVTHNMAIVSYLADDVLVMQAGKMVEMGSHETVLCRPKHEYTANLLSSVLSE